MRSLLLRGGHFFQAADLEIVILGRLQAVTLAQKSLDLIEAIDGLDAYLPLHTARADLLRRLGRDEEAAGAYARALELNPNPGERRFIERRLADPKRH